MRRLITVIVFCGITILHGNAGNPTALAATLSNAAEKITKMRAAGEVTQISDTTMTIKRKFRDKTESMEFVLDKPLTVIKPGDRVKVSYIKRDDRNAATRVIVVIPRKTSKKAPHPDSSSTRNKHR